MSSNPPVPFTHGGVVIGTFIENDNGEMTMTLNNTPEARRLWDAIKPPAGQYSISGQDVYATAQDYMVTDDEEDISEEMSLEQKIAQLLNQNCVERFSGTPDFILAHFLMSCLVSFQEAIQKRADFRGEKVEFNPSKIFDVETEGLDPHNARIISFGPSLDGMGRILSVDKRDYGQNID